MPISTLINRLRDRESAERRTAEKAEREKIKRDDRLRSEIARMVADDKHDEQFIEQTVTSSDHLTRLINACEASAEKHRLEAELSEVSERIQQERLELGELRSVIKENDDGPKLLPTHAAAPSRNDHLRQALKRATVAHNASPGDVELARKWRDAERAIRDVEDAIDCAVHRISRLNHQEKTLCERIAEIDAPEDNSSELAPPLNFPVR